VFCKRWAGYHARSRADARLRCLESFGDRIAARDPNRQTAQIHIRVATMNRFNALATDEIVPVPRRLRGKGKPSFKAFFLTRPFRGSSAQVRTVLEAEFEPKNNFGLPLDSILVVCGISMPSECYRRGWLTACVP
jgi:hypothetical protein